MNIYSLIAIKLLVWILSGLVRNLPAYLSRVAGNFFTEQLGKSAIFMPSNRRFRRKPADFSCECFVKCTLNKAVEYIELNFLALKIQSI